MLREGPYRLKVTDTAGEVAEAFEEGGREGGKQ